MTVTAGSFLAPQVAFVAVDHFIPKNCLSMTTICEFTERDSDLAHLRNARITLLGILNVSRVNMLMTLV